MHFFFLSVCPNEYQLALINLSFYIILMYSYMELQAKKLYNHPSLMPIRSFIKNMKKKPEIEIIKFNQVIASTSKNMINVHQLLLHDFIIYSDYEGVTDDSQRINKVLYYFPFQFPLNCKYAVCNFTFISIGVKFNGVMYPIKLASETENYYIVGNRINRLIICYLLKKQHNVICDEVVDLYKLELIDNNVNMITLCEKDDIILSENSYKVKDFIYADTSNMSFKEVSMASTHYPSFDNLEDSKKNECKTISESISD